MYKNIPTLNLFEIEIYLKNDVNFSAAFLSRFRTENPCSNKSDIFNWYRNFLLYFEINLSIFRSKLNVSGKTLRNFNAGCIIGDASTANAR